MKYLLLVFLLWSGCTSHRDGLREGSTDTWCAGSHGFELTIPATAGFTGSSQDPYRLTIRDGVSGHRAELEIQDSGRDCGAVLDERIALIRGASILGQGRLMMWGRPGVFARLVSPGGRILLTVINLRKRYCVFRIESDAGSLDDEAALDAAQRFLDSLLDGMRFP